MLTDLEHIERNISELKKLRDQRQSIDDQITALSLENDGLWERVRAQHARNGAELEEAARA